jgi:hypothetical protein
MKLPHAGRMPRCGYEKEEASGGGDVQRTLWKRALCTDRLNVTA